MATYNECTSIKKFIFPNGIRVDFFPEIQNLIYNHRQIDAELPEAGGMLIGYENECTGNFTVSRGTAPKEQDARSRIGLSLCRLHSVEVENLEYPYGYIGTWHTHPTDIPTPSALDLSDWKKCIEDNKNATDALVFVIGGNKAFRIWLCDDATKELLEGKEI